ncbi:MAG TPA: hypothetical protein VJW20_15170 [Candidatus Angelobacter sp.]|nr:hypothetical protein [Candidatus Angelobacter sp.]
MKQLVIALFFYSLAFGPTAMDYYNEIYKAGGLDRMAAGYTCFPDEDTGKFFIFSQSEVVRQFLIDAGEYKKLPKNQRAQLDKGFIYLRTYFKGIPRPPLYINKDGESYLFQSDMKDKGGVIRIRYTFNWTTLRYEETVNVYVNGVSPSSERSGYGRCELVGTAVKQNGKWDGDR